MKIRFALPKGSLELETFKFLEEAGYKLEGYERSYRPEINDPDIKVRILRPQEIPRLVEEGFYDIGITGIDWVIETKADVEVLQDLEYGKVKLVLAVSKEWRNVNNFENLLKKTLEEKGTLIIYTEYLNISCTWISSQKSYRRLFGESEPQVITPWLKKGTNSKVRIYLSFGATEAKPPEIADAIIDVTRTGVTLERNNLKPIEVILESSAHLIANKNSLRDPVKREKILDVLSLLKGVVEARKKLHIFINVKEENLSKLIPLLPALKGPTISPLSKKGWYAVNTVIDEKSFLKILPLLRRYAQGLVVHKPRQVLPLDEIACFDQKQ
ncbi:MAG TPA: ATP phosphoribosyltransferase [Desulfurococcales archaeon]|nr:ATP phosphoribosyltransferase [Desulfurococcales archaeon]